jgi:four helix bundle protein
MKVSAAVHSFEDLEVFQRAYRLALEVHKTSLNFPAVEQRVLGDQVRRASKSVCGNIAEGFGKQRNSKLEFKRFLRIAIGSADEMRVWARFCLDLGYIDEACWKRWRDEYQSIARMLQSLHTKSNPSSD